MTPYIYVMISSTPTRFGGALRRLGGVKYNHCAVSLDSGLEEMYSFARIQHRALLPGGLVKENIRRYTLGRVSNVDVVIFRLPVSQAQYALVSGEIGRIGRDKDYIYNFPSLISYPITKGLPTYKAYTCIEFSMHILDLLGVPLDKPCCRYTPDDLMALLAENVFYRGNLLTYVPEGEDATDYFDPLSLTMFLGCVASVRKIFVRSIFYGHR